MFRINRFVQMWLPFSFFLFFGGRHLEQLLISIPPSHSAYKADLQIGNPCKVFKRQVIRGLRAECVCLPVCMCLPGEKLCTFFKLVTMSCVSRQET